MEAYRLSLFVADLGWLDVTRLGQDDRTRSLSSQLYRALGSIAANISEGFSRGSHKDRVRFYEYALGSARESRGWYYKSRYVLGVQVAEDRLSVLNQIIRLLLRMIPEQRGYAVREESPEYRIQAGNLPKTDDISRITYPISRITNTVGEYMIITSTNIQGLQKFRTGKVRDVYDLGDELLFVASDRLSAFDVVMPNGIPDKGRVLTQLSLFWFELLKDVVPNHLVTADTDIIIARLAEAGVPDAESQREILDGRTMIVRKTQPFPVECIVRGYISGSAWKEYKALLGSSDNTVSLHGINLPGDLKESDKLPQPIFTPSTKEEVGEHDINISQQQMIEILGEKDARELIEKSLAVYTTASEYAASRGIIIADTKFEFGRLGDEIILIDEVLTPDSSRFWDVETYKPGGAQPSFDKQYVRDWLLSINFNMQPPAPELPEDVVRNTSAKYREAYRRIVGRDL